MYYIFGCYYYFSNTCYAPKDGALKRDGKKIVFPSLKDAQDYIFDLGAQYRLTKQSFTFDSYVLNHGEYSAPVYKIRKMRKK